MFNKDLSNKSMDILMQYKLIQNASVTEQAAQKHYNESILKVMVHLLMLILSSHQFDNLIVISYLAK